MNVFVAGGTGYLGQPLIHELLARGHRVQALARAASAGKLPTGCEPLIADPLQPGSYSPAGCDSFVHLIGVSHPAPWKAAAFREIDIRSVEVAAAAAIAAHIRHFIYLSVAHPSPVMRSYTAAREQCEQIISCSGLNATFVRPWYVLGPGHRWPYLLKPAYWLMERIPSKRESAQRLGLVTRVQVIATLLDAVEKPACGVRTIEVPEIRATKMRAQAAA